jgi:broad specificity phosphatase PhoE
MPPLVYFVRHGQTDWNAESRLQGQADTDINQRGREQADRNGKRLAGLIGDATGWDFVASPLKRTRETMERVRIGMGLPAQGYRTDDRLKEVHFGDWQGKTYMELEAERPGTTAERAADKWNFRPPGDLAESYAMLTARVKPFLDELKSETVCVTHGGVIRAIFRLVQNMGEDETAALDIRQDRVLRYRNGALNWL